MRTLCGPESQPPALIGVSCSWDQNSERRGHQGRRTGHSLSGPTGSPQRDELGVTQCQRGAVPSAPSSHPGCCPGRGSWGQQVSTQPHPCPPFPAGMPPRSAGSRGADAALPGPPVGQPAFPAGWASAPHWPRHAGPGGWTGAPQGQEAHVSGALCSWTLGSSPGDTVPCAGPGGFPPAGWPSVHDMPCQARSSRKSGAREPHGHGPPRPALTFQDSGSAGLRCHYVGSWAAGSHPLEAGVLHRWPRTLVTAG